MSGGVQDGDAAHPYYRYGGAWKNKVAGASAKKPKKGKNKGKAQIHEWDGDDHKYTTNDKVVYSGKGWVCRKSHFSREEDTPVKATGTWKEDDTAPVVTDEESVSSN